MVTEELLLGKVSGELAQITGKTELGQDRTAMVRHWIQQKTTSKPWRLKSGLTPVLTCAGCLAQKDPWLSEGLGQRHLLRYSSNELPRDL